MQVLLSASFVAPHNQFPLHGAPYNFLSPLLYRTVQRRCILVAEKQPRVIRVALPACGVGPPPAVFPER